jgi:protein-S-isoprenylcysteine O-methyltransferase Ste14
MSQVIEAIPNETILNETTANAIFETDSPGIVKRAAVLAYGILSYNIGVAGLVWIILAMGGLAPVGFSPLQTDSMVASILVNLGLIVLFGLQHSVMARGRFKQWLTHIIPSAAERSTYALMSGLFMMSAIYFWQPLPGTIWEVENSIAQVGLWTAYALGWSYLFIATFVTNHFELMGLRQVYLYFTNTPYTGLPFTRKYMYRYSRHPMMLGVLIGMWAVPVMTVTHLVMAVLLTVYVAIGVALEERDLLKRFGDTYHRYKKDIATFVPGMY